MATKEPATGTTFSNTLTPPGAGSTELSLVGCGVREKKIAFVTVKIFAVSFYIDASRLAGSPLGSWKGKSGSNLSKDAAFFKALLDVPVEKALKLVLQRDMEGAQFWEKTSEPLSRKLKTAGSAAQQAFKALGDVIKTRSLKQGTAIIYAWSQPGTLHVTIVPPNSAAAAAPDGTIDSAALASSWFDMFLEKEDPTSPSLKVSIASNFPSLV